MSSVVFNGYTVYYGITSVVYFIKGTYQLRKRTSTICIIKHHYWALINVKCILLLDMFFLMVIALQFTRIYPLIWPCSPYSVKNIEKKVKLLKWWSEINASVSFSLKVSFILWVDMLSSLKIYFLKNIVWFSAAGSLELIYYGIIFQIHFGVNSGATRFALENQAVNEATFRCPDELGWKPQVALLSNACIFVIYTYK